MNADYAPVMDEAYHGLLRDLAGHPTCRYDEHQTKGYFGVNHPPQAGAYGYVPIRPLTFLKALAAAVPHVPKQPIKFVDAGCGLAVTLRLAYALARDRNWYFVGEGIELQEGMDRTATTVSGGCTIRKGDILTFDYSPYNLVYFYKPFTDPEAMIKLRQRIVETVAPGTVIISADFPWYDFDLPVMSVHKEGKNSFGTSAGTEIVVKEKS